MEKKKIDVKNLAVIFCFVFASIYLFLVTGAWFVKTQSTNLVVVIGSLNIQVLGNKLYNNAGTTTDNLVMNGFEIPDTMIAGTTFNQNIIVNNNETLNEPDIKKCHVRVRVIPTLNKVVTTNFFTPNFSASDWTYSNGWYYYYADSAWKTLASQSSVTFCSTLTVGSEASSFNAGDIIALYILVEAEQYSSGTPTTWVV